jgi:DNA-binding response OmpR family regulator
VIVDLRSGNAGGFVVAKELDQVDRLRDVPVYMLLQRPQDGWLAEQAGANLYRTKPVDTGDLVADALSLIA